MKRSCKQPVLLAYVVQTSHFKTHPLVRRQKILIGISGSIAAYKIIHLVRLLVKQGAEVKVVMTTAAKDFVSPP
ncbi:flavoprotein [Niabella hibiscisoli]|uniref:flavoprotein n=1 Tax=Niabella hibiscisoli TaxID=1825928 RepID=UPI00293E1F99|nr:flavoprotein [Niabella hibiscisoli]